MINLPDFLIVGAAKSGTTALAKYLAQHPQIFIPRRKECRFFSNLKGDFKGPGDDEINKSIIKSLDEYSRLFEEAEINQLMGDASPDYLFNYKETIKKVKRVYSERGKSFPKIIIILRNPIDRAFSNYMHLVRDLRESEMDFRKALSLEEERKNLNWEWFWQYKEQGYYSNQITAFLNSFEKVKILIFDDFKENSQAFMDSVTDFLGLEKREFDFVVKHNESGFNKNVTVRKALSIKIPNRIKKLLPQNLEILLKRQKDYLLSKNLKKAKITEEEKNYLRTIYMEEIDTLGKIVKRDLSKWLD